MRFCATSKAGAAGIALALALSLGKPADSQLILIDADSPVSGFAIVARDKIELDKDSVVTGNVHANGRVKVKKDALVDGDASAVGDVDDKGVVTGSILEGAAALPLPPLPTEAAARDLADRVLESNTVLTDEMVDGVLFVDGKVRVEGTLEGSGTVIATRDIEFGDVVEGSETSGEGTLSFLAFKKIKVGKRRHVRGVFLAGQDVEVEQDARVEGILLGHKNVRLKKGSMVTFVPVEPPDTRPPLIGRLAPIEGSWVVESAPILSAGFSERDTGIDLASVVVLVDGVDRTAEAAVTADGFTLALAEPLADGLHLVSVTVADLGGRSATEEWSFTVDTLAPSLALGGPDSGGDLELAYADATAGVDLATLQVTLDGADVSRSCSLATDGARCPLPPLAPGPHEAAAVLADRAGNGTAASFGFEVAADATPPAVTLTLPVDGGVVGTTSLPFAGTVADAGGVASLAVNGRPVAFSGGEFGGRIDVREGLVVVVAEAEDAAGNRTSARATVTVDVTQPELRILKPSPAAVVHAESVTVSGIAEDLNGIAAIEVAGSGVPHADGAFEQSIALGDGSNAIVVTAIDRAGNRKTLTFLVERDPLPAVSIDSPTDLGTTAAASVDVTGRVGPGLTSVEVGGVEAVLSGETFFAAGVPLHEGANQVTAVATSAGGRQATATITLTRDTTPPRILVASPSAGTVFASSPVVVRGEVLELGGAGKTEEPTVTVAGLPAVVAGGSFIARVDLMVGDNRVEIEARDDLGNSAGVALDLRLETSAGRRITVSSGDGQSAVVATALPEPLVAAVREADGTPVAGAPVVFKVLANDGTFSNGKRRFLATTDAAGLASVTFTPGTLAGAATQVVEARSVGAAGQAVFVADTLAGAPLPVLLDAGGGQVGVAGRPLPEPFEAVVVDAFSNRVPNVPVRFRVVAGGGVLANGESSSTVVSDRLGRVRERLTLGPEEGLASNVVEVRLADVPNGPFATFTASALLAGDPAATHVTGVVLDNTDLPVPEATIRLEGTGLETRSAENGTFRLDGVPVGQVELVVDGSTTTRPGSWPELHFFRTTVPGRENKLDRPIYLLPLDVAGGVTVDENTGGTLSLAGVPGFALEVAPGSVTFPDGSKSGRLSVTQVHADRVPMAPNFGQQPRLIFTFQPPGTVFDPPARLTLPNIDGLAPGQSAEFYSFDHDLGRFVTVGRATVSEDGALLVANPGVGIRSGGWQCGGNPQATTGAPHDCPACRRCSGSDCVPDPDQEGKTCTPAKSLRKEDEDCVIERTCVTGDCEPEMVEVRSIEGPCVAARGEPVTFTVDSNAPEKVKWSALDGEPETGMGPTFTVTFASDSPTQSVRAFCGESSQYKYFELRTSCAMIESKLEVEIVEVANNSTLYTGEVKGTFPRGTYKVCVDGNRYCFKAETVRAELQVSVDDPATSTKINITDAMDEDVTDATCKDIIEDLTPPPEGTNHGPPRRVYWSEPITRAHEQFHVDDMKERVYELAFADFVQALQDRCTECPTPLVASELNDLLTDTVIPHLGRFNQDKETLAHNASNALYGNLVEAIRQRARDERWRRACR